MVVNIRCLRQKIGPVADASGRKGAAQRPCGSVSCDPLHREHREELAVSLTTGYGYDVRKSLLKPLVYVLVAAQLLLAVPAMAATITFAQGAPSSAATSGDQCPCCPDGADSMKDCLASCTLAAAALPDTQAPARMSAPHLRVDAAPAAPLVPLSDPPLKPPPII
jgi:hypothetical protein